MVAPRLKLWVVPGAVVPKPKEPVVPDVPRPGNELVVPDVMPGVVVEGKLKSDPVVPAVPVVPVVPVPNPKPGVEVVAVVVVGCAPKPPVDEKLNIPPVVPVDPVVVVGLVPNKEVPVVPKPGVVVVVVAVVGAVPNPNDGVEDCVVVPVLPNMPGVLEVPV